MGYTVEYYSAVKKKICHLQPMNELDILILSKSERERQIIYDITYMWNLNYGTNECIYKTETDSDIEDRLVIIKGMGDGVGQLGFGGWYLQTITFRMDKQGGPAVQHRKLYPISWDRPLWKII